MKKKRITRRTAADHWKDKTDWSRVRSMSDDAIERGAENDPDNPPWTESELRNAQFLLRPVEAKLPVSIRLDREVIDYFKSQGAGYQSRIGAVLLSYVRTQERNETAKRRVVKKASSARKSKKRSAQ